MEKSAGWEKCRLGVGQQKYPFGDSAKSDNQYSNLNLNQSQSKLESIPLQSKSSIVPPDRRKTNAKAKESHWNKNNNVTTEYLNAHDSKEDHQYKHQIKSELNAKNGSTLSLRIAAYENSIQENGDEEKQKNMNDALTKKVQCGTSKKLIDGKDYVWSNIKDAFQFPRIQVDSSSTEPEVMQFRASQKLLNPNELHSELDKDSKAHRNIAQCSVCQCRPLKGKRYKCGSCDDTYLCENCYNSDTNTHKDHSLEMTYNQRVFEGYEPWHADVRCNGCKAFPIMGDRFQCHECKAYDLCEQCYHDHTFGDDNETHNEMHAMKMTASPLNAKSDHYIDGVCSCCQSTNFYGAAHRCDECDNYTLCQRCFDEDRFSLDGNNNVNHHEGHTMKTIQAEKRERHSYEDWIASAIKIQNHFGTKLGANDWDEYDIDNKDDMQNFGKRIGYAIFGDPTTDDDSSSFYYLPEQEDEIKKIREHVLEMHKDASDDNVMHINFLFVCYWSKEVESQFPLIRLKKSDQCYFIEKKCRTYHSWDDFLDKNKIPEATMCYPMDGWYSPDTNGYCLLEFTHSANCDTERKIVETCDKVADVGGAVCVALSIVTLPFCPAVSTALMVPAAAAGIYDAGRSSYKLYDRYEHDETVNPLKSAEAAGCWLSLAGTVFAAGSYIGAKHLISAEKAGRHVGKAAILIRVSHLGLFGSQAIGFCSGVLHLVQKYKKGEDIPKMEYIKLAAQFLFLCSTAYSLWKVEEMVKQLREAHELQSYRKQLPRKDQRLNFDRLRLKDEINGRRTGKDSVKISLGRLRKMKKDPKWKDFFGHDNYGEAAKRHGAQPTHLTERGAEIVLEEHAIEIAKLADEARIVRFAAQPASRGNRPSKNTILFLPPFEIEDKLRFILKNSKNIVYEGGQALIKLPGKHFGYNIVIEHGNATSVQKCVFENPHYAYNKAKNAFVHYEPTLGTCKEINRFPDYVPIHLEAGGPKNTGTSICFTVFYHNYSHTENDKDS
uniref:ZZ-type domain-containing protein n=1 Tax=Panagrolaimus davidi TaxID=227884 RepID=A0A914P7K2_9BILA